MNRDETLDVLSVVALKWPHSNLGTPGQAAAGWLDELARFDRPDVEAAVRRLSAAGREHAPTAGVVRQAVELDLQGPPPSFDDLQRWLSRNCRLLPYGQTNTPSDTAAAIEQLTGAGAHEAVLRFVAAHGVYAVRMMPDPALAPLDPNQLADRRDRARDYQQRVLADWRANPTPGRALEQARRHALTAGGPRAGLRRVDPAALLPAGGAS